MQWQKPGQWVTLRRDPSAGVQGAFSSLQRHTPPGSTQEACRWAPACWGDHRMWPRDTGCAPWLLAPCVSFLHLVWGHRGQNRTRGPGSWLFEKATRTPSRSNEKTPSSKSFQNARWQKGALTPTEEQLSVTRKPICAHPVCETLRMLSRASPGQVHRASFWLPLAELASFCFSLRGCHIAWTPCTPSSLSFLPWGGGGEGCGGPFGTCPTIMGLETVRVGA